MQLTVNVTGEIQFRTATGNASFQCQDLDEVSNVVSGADGNSGSVGEVITQPTTSGGSRPKQVTQTLSSSYNDFLVFCDLDGDHFWK